MMRRNAGDYVKRWGAALIRGAATNAEFTVVKVPIYFLFIRIIHITLRWVVYEISFYIFIFIFAVELK